MHSLALFNSGIRVSSLYLIKVEVIFPQEAACLLSAGLIRVKGICLLLLNTLKYYSKYFSNGIFFKYYSIYRVIYVPMQKLPLHRPLTQLLGYV